MKNQQIRIIDVAKMAGVSAGTVDRVLHNRGKVSESSREKVQKAITNLGFKRNKIASALALKKQIHIAIITPNFAKDLYWKDVYSGIVAATKRFEDFGIEAHILEYDLFDAQTFQDKIDEALSLNIKGVLLAPQFTSAALNALYKLKSKGIDVILINSYLETDNFASYIGQNSYQSGLLAARLLSTSNKKPNPNFLILDISSKADKAYHYKQKILGFKSFFTDKEDVNVFEKNIDQFQNKKQFKLILKSILNEYSPDGLFVTNSRAHLILDLFKNQLKNTTIVGFDLVEPNVEYLQQGHIHYLINQNAFQQGYLGVNHLAQLYIFKRLPQKINYLPLDVVLPENVDYYVNEKRYFDYIL